MVVAILEYDAVMLKSCCRQLCAAAALDNVMLEPASATESQLKFSNKLRRSIVSRS